MVNIRCPNCGGEPLDEYDTGEESPFREFDCPNPSCRCQVFTWPGAPGEYE